MKLKLEIDTSGSKSKLVDVITVPGVVVMALGVFVGTTAHFGIFIVTHYLR